MRLTDVKTPLLGWNSFDAYGSFFGEKEYMENLNAFCEKLQPAGYEYFVIDIAWYQNVSMLPKNKYGIPTAKDSIQNFMDCYVDEYGRYLPSKELFPNGFKPLIDETHKRGLKFGVHMMRGVPEKAIELKLPIYGTEGITADMIAMQDPDDHCPWCKWNRGIDMSKKGAQEYYDSEIALLASWGVDFIKFDDVEGSAEEMEAIYNATDKVESKVALSLSLGSYRYLKKRVPLSVYAKSNMARITHDIWDKKDDLSDIFDGWMQRSIQEQERTPWFFFDMDMIPFGRLKLCATEYTDIMEDNIARFEHTCKFSDGQKRIFITQRAMGASPLFAGGQISSYSDYEVELLTNKEMLSCNQNAITGQLVEHKGDLFIFITPKDGDSEGWVGIFNNGDTPMSIKKPNNYVGLPINRNYIFKDVWGNCKLRQYQDNIVADIPANDVLFMHYSINK